MVHVAQKNNVALFCPFTPETTFVGAEWSASGDVTSDCGSVAAVPTDPALDVGNWVVSGQAAFDQQARNTALIELWFERGIDPSVNHLPRC